MPIHTRAMLILGGAVAFGLGFWTTQLHHERTPPAVAAQQQPLRTRAAAAGVRALRPAVAAVEQEPDAREVAASAPAPVDPGGSDYGMQSEQLPALARYRAAASTDEREDALFELALSDDPRVLPFLLDELRAARGPARLPLIESLVHYASPEAIPALQDLQRDASDPAEAEALREALEDLAETEDKPAAADQIRRRGAAQLLRRPGRAASAD